MGETRRAEMDFDAWARMARHDPAAFESMRLAAIEAVIEAASEANRERLRRLQWRIDQERRLARTPLAACIRISRMMWRSLLGPNGLNDRLGELERLVCDPAGTPDAAGGPSGGRVVPFRRPPD